MNLNRFILFLQNVDGIGDSSIRKLILSNQFNGLNLESLDQALVWIKEHLSFFSKKEPILHLTIEDMKRANLKRKQIEDKSSALGIKYISYFDENYPRRVKDSLMNKTPDFPIILYYLGDISILNSDKTCSIIGTREPSSKAISIGLELSKHMTKLDYVVISGLAEGCDTLGHKGCLEENGKTVAIVGTGLDVVFPKSNETLFKQIINNGGLAISEYPVGFNGAAYSFVQRDRLQASFSDVIIPIQTSVKGGTMHAAKAAVEKYGRKLYVVSPNLIDDGDCSGNKYLIKEYFAKEITSIEELKI